MEGILTPAEPKSAGELKAEPGPAKPFPGIAQTIGLLALLVFVQILLSIPIYFAGLYGHPIALTLPILISTGIVVAFGYRLTRAPLRKVFPFTAVRLSTLSTLMLAVFGLFLLMAQVSNLLIRLLPPPRSFMQFMGDMAGGRQSYWESLITVVIVAPFAEEILFRGLILHGFLKRYGYKTAIAVSALLFALLHGNPWQFVPGFCLGVFLAWCLARTRSLVPSLFAHMFNNSIAFIILAFQSKSPIPSPAAAAAPFHFPAAVAGLVIAVFGIGLLKRSLDRPPEC